MNDTQQSQASKRIFITGGASGLGQALAARYKKAGWRVAIGDVNEARTKHRQRGRLTRGRSVRMLVDVVRE